MPRTKTLEQTYGISVNEYAERARSFIIGDIPDYQIVKFHLLRTPQSQLEEKIIKKSDYPDYFGAKFDIESLNIPSLSDELSKVSVMKIKGKSLENDSFLGVTVKECEEDWQPEMIYIADSKVHMYESAWRYYPDKDTFNKIIKEIKKEFRQNLSLQDEYLLLNGVIEVKNLEKNNVLYNILYSRKNPMEALELCAYAAKVNLTEEDRHLWEKMCIFKPPYKEAIALIDHKDIERFRRGMMVTDKTWSKLIEERIKYAHLNGTIDLDRLDVAMPQETKDELRKCLLQGKISMAIMMSLGDGETHGIYKFLEENYSNRDRENLLKRTSHFR